MAEVVTGEELKLRVTELGTVDTTLIQGGHRVLVDHPDFGPGQASTRTIISDGIARLTRDPYPEGGFPPEQNPGVPITAGGFTKTYNVDDVIGLGATFYLGPKQFHPIVNNQGAPLIVGNTYFNTVDNIAYVFNGAGKWVPITSGAPAGVTSYYYFTSAPAISIPPAGPGTPDVNGNVLEFNLTSGQSSRDAVSVYVNGVQLVSGADYALVEGTAGAGDYIQVLGSICAGASIVVQKFGLPGIIFALSAVKANTASWVFNGTTKTFPLRNNANAAITPGSAVNCLVVSGGRVLEPGDEFTVTGSNITFTAAPLPSENIFVIVGLPVTEGAELPAPPATLDPPDVADLTNMINSLSMQIAALQSSMDVMADAVSDLQSRVTALEGA